MNYRVTKVLLLILILSIKLTSSCQEGCLSCSNNECNLCDIQNNYIKRKKTCELTNIKNCSKLDINGFCKECQENFSLKKYSNTCEIVKDHLKIENCFSYEYEICLICKNGFFVQNGKCFKNENLIKNCEIFLENNLCKKCNENFLLSVDQKTCSENTNKDENCKIFSNVYCDKCKSGFDLEKDFYKYYLKAAVLNKNELRANEIFDTFRINYEFPGICLVRDIKNCSEYNNFSSCSKCSDGFFVKEHKCVPKPEKPIAFCKKYKNLEVCLDCENGYFLATEKNCQQNTIIENCLVYQTNSKATECKECKLGLFLESKNKCIKRTRNTQNCLKFDNNSEKCSNCIEKYILSETQDSCFPIITNCSNYDYFTSSSTSITCKKCQNTFYLSEDRKTCIKGSLKNCLQYEKNDVCLNCDTNYYLTNTKICIKHPVIYDCDVYNNNQVNDCDTCSKHSVRFKIKNYCSERVIDNCETYNGHECGFCKDGYNRIGYDICEVLETGSNCLKAIEGACVKCLEGFIIINGKCFEPYLYKSRYCKTNNVSGILSSRELYECKECMEYSLPFDFKNHSVCVRNQFSGIDNIDTNCLVYNQVDKSCLSCKKGFYGDGSSCVADCGTKKIQNLEFKSNDENSKVFFKSSKKCKTTSCSTGPLLNQTSLPTISYDCVSCNSAANEFQVVNYNENLATINFRKNISDINESKFFYQPKLQCQVLDTEKIMSKKLIPNCEFYYMLHNNDFGCMKCNNFFTGIIKTWKVNNCHIYDNAQKKCQKCTNSYKISANGLECLKLNIPECRFYYENELKCKNCNEGYYLTTNGTSCTKLTLDVNCEFYSNHENKCLKCKKDYNLKTSSNFCYKKIENCKTWTIPASSGSSSKCSLCQDGYYISSDELTCILGTIDHCWKYVQNKLQPNICGKYTNIIFYEVTNYCKKPLLIEGCLSYENLNDCSQCDTHDYFLTNKRCCKYNQFWDGAKCVANSIKFCRKNLTTTATECNECDSKYQFDQYLDPVSNFKICCPINTYYHPVHKSCVNFLDISINDIGCGVFDYILQKCINCKDNFYYSDKTTDMCCPDYKYFNAGSCVPITGFNFCRKIDNSVPASKKCIECDPTDGAGTPTTLHLLNGICCKTTQYLNGTTCTDRPPNCKTYDLPNTKCQTCEPSYYKTDQETHCCKDETHAAPEFFKNSSSSCVAINGNVAGPVTDCLRYNKAEKCIKCSGTKFPSEDKLHCCEKNTTWINNNHCYPTDWILEKCKGLNKSTNLCTKCEANYYLKDNFCVENYSTIKNFAKVKILTILTDEPRCKQMNDASGNCTLCDDLYYLVNGNKNCCKNGEIFITGKGCKNLEHRVTGCLDFNFDTLVCKQNSCFSYGVETYINATNGTVCCPVGEYETGDGICKEIPDATKLKYDGATYTVPSGLTEKKAKPNCEIFDAAFACLACKTGFVLEETTKECIELEFLNLNDCSSKKVSKNCVEKKIDGADKCICVKAAKFYHIISTKNNLCCPIGTYLDANDKCIKIPNKNLKYCAILDQADITKCTECNHNQRSCIKKSDFKNLVENLDPGLYIEPREILETDSSSDLYLSSDHCCPFGKYYLNGSCITIPVENCVKYDGTNCTECAVNYLATGSPVTHCCKYNEALTGGLFCKATSRFTSASCPATHYMSNNNCCLKGDYFDIKLNKCRILLDSNCENSDSRSTCSKCKAGFVLDDTVLYKSSFKAPEIVKNCPGFSEEINLYLCQASSDTLNNIGNWIKFNSRVKNCDIFDKTTKLCTTCSNGYYITTNYDYCIPKNYYGFGNTLGLISDLDSRRTGCLVYDFKKHLCTSCESTYTLGDGLCCEAGKFYDKKTNSCSIMITDCKKFDTILNKCIKCDVGKIISNGYCCSENNRYNKDLKKCIQMTESGLDKCQEYDESTDKCITCLAAVSATHYLVAGRCCLLNYFWNGLDCETDIDKKCKKYNTDKTCIECQSGSNLQNGSQCCPDNFYIDTASTGTSIGRCVNINIPNCIVIDQTDLTKCKTCKSGYTLFNNTCLVTCGVGKYQNNNVAVTVQDCLDFGKWRDGTTLDPIETGITDESANANAALQKCKFLSGDGTACVKGVAGLTAANLLDNCKSTFYFTNGFCCDVKNKYDTVGSACQLNTAAFSTIPSMAECEVFSDDDKCLQCSTGNYLSNGGCCATGQYIKDGDLTAACVAINTAANERPNCDQINGDLCSNCTTGNLSTDGQCCGDYYWNYTDKKCVSIDTAICSTFNFFEEKCEVCTGSKYLNNSKCCDPLNYWNGAACALITVTGKVNCNKLKLNSNDCSECISSDILVDDVCRVKANFQSTYFNALKPYSLFYTNCEEINNAGTCGKCSSGNYSYNGFCVAEESYIKQADASTATITSLSIPNCLQKNIATSICTKCKTNHYFNSSINKCCPYDKGKNGTDCGTTALSPNCINFDSSNACTKCKTGFTVYTKSPNNICCEDHKFYDSNKAACVDYRKRPLKCLNFFPNIFECHIEGCENGYIFNQHCCLNNQKFNTVSHACETIPDQVYCKEYDLTKCTKCLQDEKTQYKINDICCPYEQYGKISDKKCYPIPATNPNCKKFQNTTLVAGTCLECKSTFYISENNQCCPEGQFYDNVTENKCVVSTIDKCKFYEKDAANKFICKECYPNYRLGKNKNSCCALNQVYDNNIAAIDKKCYINLLEYYKPFPNCKKFDYKNLKCLECFDNDLINNIHFYLAEDICCKFGEYKNLTNGLCEPITNSLTNYRTNCNRYNKNVVDANSKCIGCTENFKITNNSSKCESVETHCIGKEFFIENKDVSGNYLGTFTCTKCKDKHYLSNNDKCSPILHFYNTVNNTISRIDDLFCTKSLNSVCQECIKNYYMTTGKFCCENKKYCSAKNNHSDGNIKNCINYGTSVNDCTKCNSKFTLATLSGTKKCLEIQEPLCKNDQIIKLNNKNSYSCIDCEQNSFLVNHPTAKEKIKNAKYLFDCEKYDVEYLLENSTYNCLGCKYPKFLSNGACVVRTKKENCKMNFEPTIDKCKECNEGFYLDVDICKPLPTNCSLYDNTNVCYKCVAKTYLTLSEFGTSYTNSCLTLADFVVLKTEAEGPDYYKGYLDVCKPQLECEKKELGGLLTEFSKFLSCHVCVDKTYIPFVSLSGGNVNFTIDSIQRFNPKPENNKTFKNKKTGTEKNNICLKPLEPSFNFNGKAFNFPINCGVGIINADLLPDASYSKSPTPDATKMSVFCGACKPGYKPLYSNIKFHVYNCVLIQNCEIKQFRFNECDKCDDNYVFSYTDLKGVDHSDCIAYNVNKFCLASDKISGKCKICKRGYSLNYDNICENINISYCQDNSFSFQNSFLPKDLEFYYKEDEYNGCSKCEENYTAVFKNSHDLNCVKSDYIKYKQFTTVAETKYEQNCTHYKKKDNKIFCSNCENETMVTSTGKCISISSKIKNCSLQSTEEICVECSKGYLLIKNECIEKSIKKCLEYIVEEEIIKCSKCDLGYIKKNNICEEGKIQKCLEYENAVTCKKCEKNYILIEVQNEKNYCLENKDNCEKYSEFDLHKFEYNCEKCYDGYTIITPNQTNHKCTPLNLVQNCIKYEKGEYLNTTSFECLECQNGFYLHHERCLRKENIDINCKTFRKDLDLCEICNDLFYYNAESKLCKLNPSGIFGCKEYKDDKNCEFCENGYYFNDNFCVLLPEERKITNCLTYSSIDECVKCEETFVLDNKICKNTELTNCKVYQDSQNCLECLEKFVVKKVGDYNICVILPEIENCVEITKVEPYECKICKPKYFLQNKTCVNIQESEIIKNCLFYNTDKKCLFCEEGFLKIQNGTICQNIQNSENCEYLIEIQNPMCIFCKNGFKLNQNGFCEKYDNTIVTINNCILNDNDNLSNCLICKSGYYQVDKKCVAYAKNAGDEETDGKYFDEFIDKQEEFLALNVVFWIGVPLLMLFS